MSSRSTATSAEARRATVSTRSESWKTASCRFSGWRPIGEKPVKRAWRDDVGKIPERAGVGTRRIRTVDEESGITAVVDDDVEGLGTPVEHLVGAPPVLLEGLALPGEDSGGVAGDGGRGVVLGGEDVAGAPADLGAEGDEGLDEDGGLDGHVEGAGDVGALEGLGGAELLDHGHETGHLNLRELDLEATAGEIGIGNGRGVSSRRVSAERGLKWSKPSTRTYYTSGCIGGIVARAIVARDGSKRASRARYEASIAKRRSRRSGGETRVAENVPFRPADRSRTRSQPWPCRGPCTRGR